MGWLGLRWACFRPCPNWRLRVTRGGEPPPSTLPWLGARLDLEPFGGSPMLMEGLAWLGDAECHLAWSILDAVGAYTWA